MLRMDCRNLCQSEDYKDTDRSHGDGKQSSILGEISWGLDTVQLLIW